MQATIRARIRVLLPAEGGTRSVPVYPDYRPIVEFDAVDCALDGRFHLIDVDSVAPGEECEAIISFHAWEYVRDRVRPGSRFVFRECWALIGTGDVLSISPQEEGRSST